jgi:hypothetical protein
MSMLKWYKVHFNIQSWAKERTDLNFSFYVSIN